VSTPGIPATREAVVLTAERTRSVALVTIAASRPGCTATSTGPAAREAVAVSRPDGPSSDAVAAEAAVVAVVATVTAGRPAAGWPDSALVVVVRRRSSSEMSSSRMVRRRRSRGARSVRQAAMAATPGRELLTPISCHLRQ
jgi:hypothetical protein